MTITFFSIKGGVGKSAIAFYLSRTYYWKTLNQFNYYVQKDFINPRINSLPALINLEYFDSEELTDLPKHFNTDQVNIVDLKTGFTKSHIPLLQSSDYIVIPFLTTDLENEILLATLKLLEVYIESLPQKVICVPNRYLINWKQPKTLYRVAVPIGTTKVFSSYDFSKPNRYDINALYPLYKNFF